MHVGRGWCFAYESFLEMLILNFIDILHSDYPDPVTGGASSRAVCGFSDASNEFRIDFRRNIRASSLHRDRSVKLKKNIRIKYSSEQCNIFFPNVVLSLGGGFYRVDAIIIHVVDLCARRVGCRIGGST